MVPGAGYSLCPPFKGRIVPAEVAFVENRKLPLLASLLPRASCAIARRRHGVQPQQEGEQGSSGMTSRFHPFLAAGSVLTRCR